MPGVGCTPEVIGTAKVSILTANLETLARRLLIGAKQTCSLAGEDNGPHDFLSFMRDHPATPSHSADLGCRTPR
jgi:hypothetical protein